MSLRVRICKHVPVQLGKVVIRAVWGGVGGGGGANYHIKRRQNALCINSAGTINGFSLATAMHSSCNPGVDVLLLRGNIRVCVKPFSLFLKRHSKNAGQELFPERCQNTLFGELVAAHKGNIYSLAWLYFPRLSLKAARRPGLH